MENENKLKLAQQYANYEKKMKKEFKNCCVSGIYQLTETKNGKESIQVAAIWTDGFDTILPAFSDTIWLVAMGRSTNVSLYTLVKKCALEKWKIFITRRKFVEVYKALEKNFPIDLCSE